MILEPKTIKEFEKILDENETVVIDFMADWCGTCKMYSPIFEKVSKDTNNATFVKVDVDTLSDISAEWGIQSIPTTVFMKNNKEASRFSGFIAEDKLRNDIKDIA